MVIHFGDRKGGGGVNIYHCFVIAWWNCLEQCYVLHCEGASHVSSALEEQEPLSIFITLRLHYVLFKLQLFLTKGNKTGCQTHLSNTSKQLPKYFLMALRHVLRGVISYLFSLSMNQTANRSKQLIGFIWRTKHPSTSPKSSVLYQGVNALAPLACLLLTCS